jgi:hypothetical protein
MGRAVHRRDLLRTADRIELRDQIRPAQRDPEQELRARHDGVPVMDANAALAQLQLEATDVFARRAPGRVAKVLSLSAGYLSAANRWALM